MANTCNKCNKEGSDRFLCREDDCIYSFVRDRVTPISVSDVTPKDIPLKEVKEGVLPEIKIKKRFKPLRAIKKVTSNPVFKAIAMQTRIGRIAYTVAGSIGIGTLTLNNLIMFEDLSMLQIGITLVGMGLAWVVATYVKNSALASKLEQLVDVLSDELVKATSDASDGGKIVTKGEAQSIVKSVLNAIFSK